MVINLDVVIITDSITLNVRRDNGFLRVALITNSSDFFLSMNFNYFSLCTLVYLSDENNEIQLLGEKRTYILRRENKIMIILTCCIDKNLLGDDEFGSTINITITDSTFNKRNFITKPLKIYLLQVFLRDIFIYCAFVLIAYVNVKRRNDRR
ncbi:hypothetical protein RCL_jg16394.t1 [Rhizophagus clarus]|uniref:Uncharacterized protein n=1 Tax=Rhizophagus clarus TaxID=94130 RepID=A0A8H3M010_9GLOM|nr:hypothetical protein RCL_jg16394.t1 [Rhizophagus clarus]